MYPHHQGGGRFQGQPQPPMQNPYQGYQIGQGMPVQQYPPHMYQGLNPHGQQYMPMDPSQNPQRGSIKGNFQYPGKPAALIQPPSLNTEEQMDTNSQFFQQRGPMTISNNQHSQFDGYNQQEDPNWGNDAQIESMFWEQRCMTMLERFQWFYERFQLLRDNHLSLSEEMQKMDSEEEWHTFQEHHEEFHQKIEEMEQELSAVLGENEQLLQQRPTQDNQGVWEQRYQELLGNFKSLQQEMTHMESSGGRGGIPTEQFRQLEEHCTELEYQYEQCYNQLKMYREGGISPEIEHQMNAYAQDIESYKEKVNSLHGENVELQKMLEEYDDQLKQERQKSMIDRGKFQNLIRQVQEKEREINSLQNQFKNRSSPKASITQYEQNIQEKNREIEELKKTIADRNNQLELEKNAKIKIREEFEQIKRSQQKKEEEYLSKINDLKQQLQKTNESISKVQNLQRKLTYSNQQVANLNDNLKKKNQELIQLRSLAYEVQKLKEAQSDLVRTAEERDRFAQLARKKGQEIDKMHHEIDKLNGTINQINSKRQEYSTRNLRIEIEDLNDQLRRNEGQINKLKSIISMKEDYAQKLQDQNRQTRSKLIMIEQTLNSERELWQKKQVKLSAKSYDYSEKIRALDYEFNLQMKDTLEKEIATLRRQNAEKQENIRSLEDKEIFLQSKISIYQKQEGNYSRDLKLQKQKERDLVISLENQTKKYKELQSIVKGKDQQIESIEKRLRQQIETSSSLKLQIQENQRLIRVNSKAIKELQAQLNISVTREVQANKLVIENTHLKMTIESLQREKAEKETPLSKSKGLSAVNSRSNLESKEGILNQLCRQNQFLKEEILKMMTYQQSNTHGNNKTSVDLNKRLNEFNQRLHITIANSSNPHGPLSRSESEKTMIIWEKERDQLIKHYEKEIKAIRQQFDVRKNTGLQPNSSQKSLTKSKKHFFGNLQSQNLKEQNAFLKQKAEQQEQRNKNLIKVNEELREKIDSMLKIRQSATALEYYKAELQRSEGDKESLKEKLKKANEQSRVYKLELLSKNTKLSQEYDFKVMQLELQIQQLQRKISLLQGEKASANNQRATNQHEAILYNLSKNNKKQSQNLHVGTPKSSNNYKSGIQQQFGSLMGGYQNYGNHGIASKVSGNGASVRDSRYQVRTDERY